jgi:hypothetical protein
VLIFQELENLSLEPKPFLSDKLLIEVILATKDVNIMITDKTFILDWESF